MSSKLMKYTEDFKVSRPIFRLRVSGNRVSASTSSPIHKFRPEPIPNDPLSKIVCKSYEESFSIERGIFKVDKEAICQRSMNAIRERMLFFIERNIGMRSPRQSKLYRWAYRNMPNTYPVNDGLVMIYSYISKYAGEDLRMPSMYKDHLDNAIALLDAMRIKHE